MAVVLAVLGWILVALVAAIAVIVLVPVHFEARGALNDDRVDGAVEARWGWGIGRVEIGLGVPMSVRLLGVRVYTGPEERKRAERPKRERRPKKKKKRKRTRLEIAGSVRRHRSALRGMIGRLLATLRFRVFVGGVIGLDDPGDTALLVEVLRLAEGRSRALDLRIRADFLDAALSLRCRVRVRFWLAHLGAVALASLVRRENRRAIRAVLFT